MFSVLAIALRGVVRGGGLGTAAYFRFDWIGVMLNGPRASMD